MFLLFVYRVAIFLVYAVIYPYTRLRAYFGNLFWRERLGLITRNNSAQIWLHAASVGETKVLSHLVHYLIAKRPSLRLHVTVSTEAGHKTADSLFGKQAMVTFAPFDVHVSLDRFFRKLKPQLLVCAETEIWPGMILEVTHRNTPIVLVNGRMSERSFNMYRRITKTMKILLGRYTHFFFRSAEDATRYRHFGVTADKTTIAGDMKFDAPAIPVDALTLEHHRHELGLEYNDFVVVAGSTRDGEEALLAESYRSLATKIPRCKFVIAPRHIERVDAIASKLAESGIAVARYGIPNPEANLMLVDKMGILHELYALGKVAFVGGTLVPVGGHNLLEPVWVGTPVLFGSHTANVGGAAEFIVSRNYGKQVQDSGELTQAIEAVYLKKAMFTRYNPDSASPTATALCGDYLLKLIDAA